MRSCELTYEEAHALLESGELSSRELTESVLDRIDSVEPAVSAYVTVRNREDALADAAGVDQARARGERVGALAGLPVAVKDNVSTRGLPTTAGSEILRGYVPPFDATVVERLRAAGAVIVGKTNMDEFGMGSSNENSAFGPTRNPWALDRVPGGSSGGSAAAVAAGETPLSLGSDTGGSVRQPAGFCGVVGVKPTYGRVSRYGLLAFASSLDQIGPISRDVAGAAALLSVIAGRDPRDSTTATIDVPDYLDSVGPDLSGVSVGVAAEYFAEGLAANVQEAVRRAIATLSGLGADVREISLPHMRYGVAAYYLVANAEASSNLARYDGVGYGCRAPDVHDLYDMYAETRSRAFGAEVKRRIMLGTYALSAGYYDRYYLTAQKVRSLIASDFERAFGDVDAIVAPTSPTTAFRLGERVDDPLRMYLSDVYTIPVNLAGIAAISVPCGSGEGGLPVGLQIMVDRFHEPLMFRVAHAYEQAAALPRAVPDL